MKHPINTPLFFSATAAETGASFLHLQQLYVQKLPEQKGLARSWLKNILEEDFTFIEM